MIMMDQHYYDGYLVSACGPAREGSLWSSTGVDDAIALPSNPPGLLNMSGVI